MRVNISYSIEFDDVPSKVLEFMKEADTGGGELTEIYESIVGAIDKKNYTVAVEQMAAMRDILASIDARLDDCMHIMAGYSKTLAEMAVGGDSKAEYPPEVVQALETELRRLQEKKNETEKPQDG
tara:strand:+ start:777 stop:1151 length:375 start_codon:yes stop_codon:yes gene_type:complete